MTKFNFNNAVPLSPTSAGEAVKEQLRELGMKQSELAKICGLPKSALGQILKGRRALTPEVALLIEKAVNLPVPYLMNLQKQYELDRARKDLPTAIM